MLTQDVLRGRAVQLSDAERRVLESAVSHSQTYDAGSLVVRQGSRVKVSTLLVKGLMTRHIDAPDGRRHLVGLHLPGDFVDLHAYPLKSLDHQVTALTDIAVAVFPHAALEEIQASDVQLTRRLWFLTLLDAAMHRQWIYRLASLNAVQRVAHFVCETHARLLAIGASDGKTFTLPMTQADIGEVCSLTNVHVSRVLRELRDAHLCNVRASRVEILNWGALAALAFFDPAYLYLEPELEQRLAARQGASDD